MRYIFIYVVAAPIVNLVHVFNFPTFLYYVSAPLSHKISRQVLSSSLSVSTFTINIPFLVITMISPDNATFVENEVIMHMYFSVSVSDTSELEESESSGSASNVSSSSTCICSAHF